jgi:hypothetical protein
MIRRGDGQPEIAFPTKIKKIGAAIQPEKRDLKKKRQDCGTPK